MLLGYERPIVSGDTWSPVFNKKRFHHAWVIGKTGQGKSTFLVNSAIQDILNGEGIAFIDPHGDAIDAIMRHVPPDRLILLDPSVMDNPIGINPLHNVTDVPFVASAIVDTFKSIWGHSWGPQLEQYLYNGIAALSEMQDGTLLGLKYLITSKKYRHRVISSIIDPIIKDFWDMDFEELMPDKEKRQNTLSTLNKIGALISDPKIRNVIGQPLSTIDFKDIIDNKKCLLVRLPQGKLGIQKASMLGALIMAQLHLAALSRDTRNPFHIYADEAHNYGTSTIAEMLSGVRKFNVSLVLAHQYIDQLSPSLQSAFIGNVGTIVSFKIGITDAEVVAKEMDGESIHLTPRDLIRLPPYTAWVKTGGELACISMNDIDFPEYPDSPRLIKEQTARYYGRDRSLVENKINKFIRNN